MPTRISPVRQGHEVLGRTLSARALEGAHGRLRGFPAGRLTGTQFPRASFGPLSSSRQLLLRSVDVATQPEAELPALQWRTRGGAGADEIEDEQAEWHRAGLRQHVSECRRGQAQSSDIEIIRSDDIVENRRVGVIHLDFEDFEEHALTGALECIRRDRPLVVLEHQKSPNCGERT